jgi:hypothetical protein
VLQHEVFELTVVGAAPARSDEECPADLDLAPLRVVVVEAGHADDLAGCPIDRHERLPRAQQRLEVRTEDFLAVTVLDRVLLPDAGIGRSGVQPGEVVRAEGPKAQKLAVEAWLVIEPLLH